MSTFRAIFLRFSGRICAVPLHHVIEVLRPLPIDPVAGCPDFVSGLSVIRGKPTPVIRLSILLDPASNSFVGRFVTLRVDDRVIALAVEDVSGIHDLDNVPLEDMPPLLRDANAGWVERVGTLDSQLLIVLNAMRILPDEIWQTLMAREMAT